jgi:hypothetical protein
LVEEAGEKNKTPKKRTTINPGPSTEARRKIPKRAAKATNWESSDGERGAVEPGIAAAEAASYIGADSSVVQDLHSARQVRHVHHNHYKPVSPKYHTVHEQYSPGMQVGMTLMCASTRLRSAIDGELASADETARVRHSVLYVCFTPDALAC